MLNVGFKVIIRIILSVFYFIGLFLLPLQILYGYVFTPKRRLPAFRDTLLEIPAVDLAEKIRKREVSVLCPCPVVRRWLVHRNGFYLQNSYLLQSL